jgi:hypothetical protein
VALPETDPHGAEPARGSDSRTARAWFIDGLGFVISSLFAIGVIRAQIDSGADPSAVQMSIGVAVVGCLALWWRRSWPLPIAVVLILLAGFWSSAQIPALMCLGTVAVQESTRRLALVAVIGLATTMTRVLAAFPGFRFSVEIESSSSTADGGSLVGTLLLSAVVIL